MLKISRIILIIYLTFIVLLTIVGCNKTTGTIKNEKYNDWIYTGDWKNNKPNGYGIGIMSSNTGLFKYASYEGEWKDGERNGRGFFTTEIFDGTVIRYEGEFVNGISHGQGELTTKFSHGHTWTYIGEFKDGSQHGQGREIKSHADGSIISDLDGYWEDGEFIE